MTQRPHLSSQSSQSVVLPIFLKNSQVSIHNTPSLIQGRQLSDQESLSAVHSRRVSLQEPLTTTHSRRVSLQEPLSRSRRVSTQQSPPSNYGRRISTQEPRSVTHSRLVSIQESLPTSQSRRISMPDTSLSIYSRRFSNRESLSLFQTRYFAGQSVPIRTLGTNLEPLTQDSPMNNQSLPLTTQGLHISSQDHLSIAQPSSTFTSSPQGSIRSTESIMWSSPEHSKDCLPSNQPSRMPPDSSAQDNTCIGVDSSGSQHRGSRILSLLPIGWRLLHEAKKISRMVCLALSVAGMVIICLISLGQPWMHFQVPLRPLGDPAGSPTFPINTIFFVRCLDISCLQEYDQNAYLLDCAWLFIFVSGLTGFCICITLLNSILFTSSNLPLLDFSLFITSTLTGTSMILGTTFYLLQAQEYLQEGMTYRLGFSFYLAWTGIFFFFTTGFLSYMNYINFWSILALHAIWT